MSEQLDFEPPRGEYTQEAWHGIGISIAFPVVEYPSYKQKLGPQIIAVTSGGGAESAGIKPGDMILEIDGKPVESLPEGAKDFVTASLTYIRDRAVGQILVLLIKRNDEETLIKVRIGPISD